MSATQTSTRLGKYRLIAELGHGGMADVFLAVVSGPGGFQKLVVIKQLRASLSEDPDFLAMFLDEAQLAARLNHPNAIHTYEVGSDGGKNYIAMEYLEGQPLNVILRHFRAREGLPLAMHLRVLADALIGLHYAHELADYDGSPLGVVHRDVTPQNVFVTYDGQVKVVDFGIAKAMNSTSETRTGVIKGKIAYMAPEQARSEPCDRRTDVFAAGVMLWEAAAGRRLWKGLNDITVLQRLISDTPIPSPRTVDPAVSETLAAACMKALSPRPSDRFATAAELQAAIEDELALMKDRTSGRDVGGLIAREFAVRRAEIRSIVETQLSGSQLTGEAAFALPSAAVTSASSATRVSDAGGGAEQLDSGAHTSTSASMMTSTSAPDGPFRTGSRRRRGVLGAAGVALLAAGGIYWGVSHPEAASSPRADDHAALAPPTVPAAPPASVPAEQATIRLKAVPDSARIYLDNRLLPSNPYSGLLAPDDGKHQVKVEAAGYHTVTRVVRLDDLTGFEVELEKADAVDDKRQPVRGRSWPVPPVRKGPAPSEPAAADPVPPPKPPAGGKPIPNIDPGNPWEKTGNGRE